MPPERTHQPTSGIKRVCSRGLDKPRRGSALGAQLADGDAEDLGGGASLTAVLLAFLNVSLVARGKAEGNRGRGLMVTWIDWLAGGGKVEDDEAVGSTDVGMVAFGETVSPPWHGATAGCMGRGESRAIKHLGGSPAEEVVIVSGLPRGIPSSASTTRKKSRRAARHSFSWLDRRVQSSASTGTPRAVQNMVFLDTLGPLENICIVRSLRENRILLAAVELPEITEVVDRELALISTSARGSLAMSVHMKVPSYIMN